MLYQSNIYSNGFVYHPIDVMIWCLSLTFLLKLVYVPATFVSSFKNGLSTRWILVNYPILACTQVASKNEYQVGRVLNVKRWVITKLVN